MNIKYIIPANWLSKSMLLGSYSAVDKYIETFIEAKHGNSRAQYNLGLMYANGIGVPKNYELAADWFRNAAEQGYAKAQYCLSVMYYKGHGVPCCDKDAYAWVSVVLINSYESS